MMMRNPKDNYKETHQAIARRVLNSKLAAFVGHPTFDGRLERLEAAANGTEELLSAWTFLDVEFRRAGTNCSLEVRADVVNSRWDGQPTLDNDGNEWNQYSLTTKINWPCHGSTDAATALARVALYQEVAMLAAEIQAEFPDCMRMTRSATDIMLAKIKEKHESNVRALNAFVAEHRKNMRVGTMNLVGVRVTPDFPAGTYDVELDNKKFTVEVFDTGVSHLLRTA
jgi:hypothetical protein